MEPEFQQYCFETAKWSRPLSIFLRLRSGESDGFVSEINLARAVQFMGEDTIQCLESGDYNSVDVVRAIRELRHFVRYVNKWRSVLQAIVDEHDLTRADETMRMVNSANEE